MKIYYLEANGRTNTGEYVRNITEAIDFSQGNNNIAVFTSYNSFHQQRALEVFRNYSESHSLLKLWLYFLGWLRLSTILQGVCEECIFHVHWLRFSPIDYWFLRRIKRNKFVRLIFTVHNSLPHEASFFDNYLYPRIYSLFDHLIFHCRQNVVDFEKIFSKNNVQKDVVPHYSYNVKPYVEDPDKAVKLLFFGAIRPYKGLDLLLSALAEIGSSRDWELIIAGKPEYDIAYIRNEVRQNKILKERIHWKTGWIKDDEIPKLFKKSHIVILPYRKIDNSGLVHLAMSYGKTVVVPQIGVFKDLIEEGINGYFFACNDFYSLADKLIHVFDKGDYKRIGEAAVSKMEEHSLENIGKKIQNIYKQHILF